MFHLKLLGSAAGGGIPQWNCACTLCDLSRRDPRTLAPRLQLQAAVSSDDERWILLNASPDLRLQIEAHPELQPSAAKGRRNTPIEAIVLTSADLDQVLGLLLLREFQPLVVYATALVRRALEANSFFKMLHRVESQLTWIEMTPGDRFSLGASGIMCTPIPLPGGLPVYVQEMNSGAIGDAVIGLLLERGERSIAYTPAVGDITPSLKRIYETCDLILVDGTFWSDAELAATHAGTPLARAIGHIPVSGPDGTIALLADVTKPEKIFVHINNTNPMLDPRGAEYSVLTEAGWKIGYDGWELNWL